MAFPAPAAAWNYAETSGAVVDRSGNGRGFTPTGTTTRTAAGNGYTYGGTVPGAKGLTQSSNEIQLGPSLTGLDVTPWSMGTWAKAGAADPSWFLEFFRALTDNTGVRGWLTLSGTMRGRLKNSSGTAFEQAVTPDGTNYHYFAMTHDGTNLKVYRDTGGTLALIGTVPAAFTPWAATEFRIFDNSGSGCVLSDTRIWASALTLAELQEASSTPVVDAAVAVSGTFTGNLPAFTGSLTGNAAARGTAAGPIPAMVGALTGRAAATGTEDGTLPALIGSFAGKATTAGGFTAALPGFSGALTGNAEARGDAAGPLPGFVGAFSGAVGTGVSGALASTLPALTGALVGHTDVPEYTAPTHWSLTTAPGATARTRSTAFTATSRQPSYTATTRSDT